MKDIIVIGAGPAGLTAAIYAVRAGKSVTVIEKSTFGGQMTFSPKIENYPGFSEISGNELADKMVEQALGLGAEIECAEVTGVSVGEGGVKTVSTDSGDFEAYAVIIATGARHRLLGLEREEQFIGEGISFCAVCDGAFYEGKTVAVIGGGNSALQEALMLSELAKKVYLVQNLDFLTGEKRLAENVYAKENIEVILGTVVDKLLGDATFEGITVKKADGACSNLALDGMFIAIGLVPQNEPFADLIALDERGYAKVSEDARTDKEGIFVAGDCRTKKIRQVATAAADGAVAALAACDYVESLK